MNGLSLAPDGFPTDGRTATATAASDRNTAGQRRAAAGGNAFSEIVSSLARPPEAASAAGVAADADAAPSATPGPLMRAALALAPETTGDDPAASPAAADPRLPAGDGDTAPSPRPNGAPAGRRVGATLSALAVGTAPEPGTVTPGTAAKATGPVVGEPRKSIWTELTPQDRLPAELTPRDSASTELTPWDSASTDRMPPSVGRLRDGAGGAVLPPRVPHHGGERQPAGKAAVLAAEPSVRSAGDAAPATGNGRTEDDPTMSASTTGAAWPAEAPAAGAASTGLASTGLASAVAPATILPNDAPSAAFVPNSPVVAPPAPGAAAPAEKAAAMPAAEPAKPSSGSAAMATAENGPASTVEGGPSSAPASTPAPGAVAGRPTSFDTTAAATTETAAAAVPAVASLVGRVAVHVREMRTHFAPVTARPASIAGEPGAVTARAPAGNATPAEAAPEAAPIAPAGAAAPSDGASPPAAPSPAGARAAIAGAPSSLPPPDAIPAPAAQAADAGAAAPSDAGPASAAYDRRSRGDAARVPTAGAEHTSEEAEAAPRRADTAAATRQESRQQARAGLGADPGAGVRADARAENAGPASPTTAAGGGLTADTALRTLAEDIGRAARTASGQTHTTAPANGIGSSSPFATRRDVELELRSPDFGVVRLRMRLTGSSLELRLRTDDAATLTLLADRRADLEKAISEFGVDATVVDVGRVSQPASPAAPFSAHGQGPAGDSGRGPDGQRFEQQPSPGRDDRRPSPQHHTDGSTSDEDQPARSGPRAGTLFV